MFYTAGWNARLFSNAAVHILRFKLLRVIYGWWSCKQWGYYKDKTVSAAFSIVNEDQHEPWSHPPTVISLVCVSKDWYTLTGRFIRYRCTMQCDPTQLYSSTFMKLHFSVYYWGCSYVYIHDRALYASSKQNWWRSCCIFFLWASMSKMDNVSLLWWTCVLFRSWK